MLPNATWDRISSFWGRRLSPQGPAPPSRRACLMSPVSPNVPRTGIGKLFLNREGKIFSLAGHMVSVRTIQPCR